MSRNASQFIHDYVGAMNRHDATAVLSFFVPDAAYEDAAIGTVRRGYAEVMEFVSFFFHCYHNVHYTPHSVIGDTDRIAWEWTLEGN
jgi:ketosteroid isomerase-like protein